MKAGGQAARLEAAGERFGAIADWCVTRSSGGCGRTARFTAAAVFAITVLLAVTLISCGGKTPESAAETGTGAVLPAGANPAAAADRQPDDRQPEGLRQDSAGVSAAGPIAVFVGVMPQKFFVERIGGPRVSVESLVPPGADPHTYEPSPRTIMALAGARLYFKTGLPFEDAFLRKVAGTLPDLRIVDLREGVELLAVEETGPGDAEAHALDDGHGHEHGLDPHIWMDPVRAVRQAWTIRDALVALDPAGADAYRAGFEAFKSEAEALDRELQEYLEPVRGGTVFVYHPSFGYFTDRYGLRQHPVETGGGEPTPRQLQLLIGEARRLGAKTIIVQPEFSKRGAETLASAIDGAVVAVDPLAYDWFGTLRGLAKIVRNAIQ
jgi:zinc transport system substrate-binding protein